MKNKFVFLRKEYSLGKLDVKDVNESPLQQFLIWFDQAVKSGVLEPNAMTISTLSEEGKPTARSVLLKEANDKGFVFYTNYFSRKGIQLEKNPFACLSFLWLELQRQVIIEGEVKKVSDIESDKYFALRPRQSQIGAWASKQSSEANSRKEFEKAYEEFEKKFENKEVLRPPHWGGYRLIPKRIEFWQGRESRLHDRILYILEHEKWKIKRLSP